VDSWNAGAERFKGYTAGEIIGRHFSTFLRDEDRAAGLPGRALEAWRARPANSRPRAGACARTAALLGQRGDRPDPRGRGES
jgi:PAS domain-containing protein